MAAQPAVPPPGRRRLGSPVPQTARQALPVQDPERCMEPFTHGFIMLADDRCQSYHYEGQGEGFHAALQDRRSTGSMQALPSIVEEQQGSQLIQHAMDSISRVASAIEHAASLSRSAAAAFEEQVEYSYVHIQAEHRFQTGGSPLSVSSWRTTAFSGSTVRRTTAMNHSIVQRVSS